MKKFCFILVFLLITWITAFAQDSSIDSIYSTTQYKFPKLPAFSVLFDSIKSRSPQVLKLEQSKLETQISLGVTKGDWMNYISLNSSFNYGKGGSISSSQAGSVVVPSYSNQVTTTYGGGFGVGFALSSILQYGAKVRLAKVKVTQAEYELDVFEQELRYKIFQEYTQLESNLEAFKSSNLLMEMSNAQIIIAEKEYRQGLSNLEKLIAARQMYIATQMQYESLKRNCKVGMFYFEQLSGIDFREYNNQTGEE